MWCDQPVSFDGLRLVHFYITHNVQRRNVNPTAHRRQGVDVWTIGGSAGCQVCVRYCSHARARPRERRSSPEAVQAIALPGPRLGRGKRSSVVARARAVCAHPTVNSAKRSTCVTPLGPRQTTIAEICGATLMGGVQVGGSKVRCRSMRHSQVALPASTVTERHYRRVEPQAFSALPQRSP